MLLLNIDVILNSSHKHAHQIMLTLNAILVQQFKLDPRVLRAITRPTVIFSLLSAFLVPGKSTRRYQQGALVHCLISFPVPVVSTGPSNAACGAVAWFSLICHPVASCLSCSLATLSFSFSQALQRKHVDTRVNSMEYSDSRKPKPGTLEIKPKRTFGGFLMLFHPNQSFPQKTIKFQ